MMTSGSDIHARALAALLQLTLGQEPSRVDTESAYDHIAECSTCWSQFSVLTETLIGERPEELGEAVAEQWLPAAPTFGEQWLLQHHTPAAGTLPGYWQRGRGYLARLAEDVEQHVTALLVSLQYLLTGPSPAYAHRGSGETREDFDRDLILDVRRPLEIELSCDDLPDLRTVMILKSDVMRPDLVRPRIEVSIPSRWPDFSGVRIMLDDGTQQVERTTGRTGTLEFDAIPRSLIPSLNFIIQPPRITM